ncbi:GDSL-type esterase/lipase family protein [Paenibacillus albus]|uniref:SGNH hydrolase-type esterase domain-containing protein n=1 Tax=Paenibacillus albus TaxID=2495582 RepID=A0A3S9A3L5_9BACL|nr:GDSL-type esterase/lipase family protein [Paenibacillus albus]AZN40318.1 hypothetical protein EJC50_12180 [Paenibacillus albus]
MIRHQMKWHNVAEFLPDVSGLTVCSRVPSTIRDQLNPLAQTMALRTAGVELRFRMQSDEVKLTLKLMKDEDIQLEARMIEVYYGCISEQEPYVWDGTSDEVVLTIRKPEEAFFSQMRAIADLENAAFRPELVRVLLPMGAKVAFVQIEGELSPPEPGDEPAERWLAYGSSITYGASATLQSSTYVNRTAAALKVDAINLGFPGSALLDEAMAMYIASRQDWNFATLELGINVIWDMEKQAFVPVETFKQKLDVFIPLIAKMQPNKPIYCIDIFSTRGDIEGSTLTSDYREAVRATVAELNLPHVIHLDGRALLPELSGLSRDLIHPSALGMALIAERLTAAIIADRAVRDGLVYASQSVVVT